MVCVLGSKNETTGIRTVHDGRSSLAHYLPPTVRTCHVSQFCSENGL